MLPIVISDTNDYCYQQYQLLLPWWHSIYCIALSRTENLCCHLQRLLSEQLSESHLVVRLFLRSYAFSRNTDYIYESINLLCPALTNGLKVLGTQLICLGPDGLEISLLPVVTTASTLTNLILSLTDHFSIWTVLRKCLLTWRKWFLPNIKRTSSLCPDVILKHAFSKN